MIRLDPARVGGLPPALNSLRIVSCLSAVLLGTGCGPEPAPADFEVVSLLRHEEALNRPHDIELAGPLAFVPGKGGSIAVIDVSRPETPELLWWRSDPVELEDAETVLPMDPYLALGTRDFFVLNGLQEPRSISIAGRLLHRPEIDRINGMVAWNGYILAANKLGYVAVLDVREPLRPALLGALDTKERGELTSPHDIALWNEHAVVVDQADRPSRTVEGLSRISYQLRLYRFTGPDGTLLPPAQWDVRGAVRGDLDLNGANRVVVSGDIAFIACSRSNTIGSIDLSDPDEPRLLATVRFADRYPTGLEVAGRVLFAAGGQALQAIDVSDPAHPRVAAEFLTTEVFPTGLDNAHDLVFRDGLLYVTAQNDFQIGILRVTNPEVLRLAGAR